jgi:hypothetical protein
MVYLHCPGYLDYGLVKKSVQIGMCARKLPDVGQNANMTPELVEDAVFACLVRKFLHQLLTLQPLNRARSVHQFYGN